MKKIRGIIYAMLSSAAFGLNPIWTKDAWMRGVNTMSVLFWRLLSTAFILLIYFLIKKINFKINKNEFKSLLVIGILGYGCTTICLFTSYSYISGGLATTLHFIYPTVVTILMILIYKDKLSQGKIFAIIFSTLGIYFLINTKNMQINYKGVILAIVSGVFYSIYIIGIEKGKLERLDVLVVTFYITIISTVCVVTFGIFHSEINFVTDYRSVLDIFGATIISTLLALIAFTKGIKMIGSSNAAILSTFEPIVSVILGILFLNEKITIQIVIGIFLIISSVLCITLKDKFQNKVVHNLN